MMCVVKLFNINKPVIPHPPKDVNDCCELAEPWCTVSTQQRTELVKGM